MAKPYGFQDKRATERSDARTIEGKAIKVNQAWRIAQADAWRDYHKVTSYQAGIFLTTEEPDRQAFMAAVDQARTTRDLALARAEKAFLEAVAKC